MFYIVDLITEKCGSLSTPFNEPIQSDTPEEALKIMKGSINKYVPFFDPEEFIDDIKHVIVYECDKNGKLETMVYMEPRDQQMIDTFNALK